jgi:16S rRNA (cytosine967-C5)-methyltransferase
LQKLKRRTARAKAFNYRAALWDGGAKLPTKTKFDGVLVDAPAATST